MSKDVPKWLGDLALDVYKVIQQYDAMPRFRDMVEMYVADREAQLAGQKEWESRRRQHFERVVRSKPRLRDQKAGPPKKHWEWECYNETCPKQTRKGWRFDVIHVEAWSPPDLLSAAQPEITQTLPLTREHKLTLSE